MAKTYLIETVKRPFLSCPLNKKTKASNNEEKVFNKMFCFKFVFL